MSDLLLRLLNRLQISVRRRRKILPRARALVLDDAQRVLLVMHPQEKQWRLPGGFVQEDESAIESLQHTVQRLAGLTFSQAIPIVREQEGEFRPDAMYGDLFQLYATIYLVTTWQGELNAPEVDWGLAFFPDNDLPSHTDPEVARALKALQTYRQTGHMRVM